MNTLFRYRVAPLTCFLIISGSTAIAIPIAAAALHNTSSIRLLGLFIFPPIVLSALFFGTSISLFWFAVVGIRLAWFYRRGPVVLSMDQQQVTLPKGPFGIGLIRIPYSSIKEVSTHATKDGRSNVESLEVRSSIGCGVALERYFVSPAEYQRFKQMFVDRFTSNVETLRVQMKS